MNHVFIFSNDINRPSINFVLISLENKVIKSTVLVLHTTFFVFRLCQIMMISIFNFICQKKMMLTKH